MKQVVDNFVKSSFKILGTPVADEKKQAIIKEGRREKAREDGLPGHQPEGRGGAQGRG